MDINYILEDSTNTVCFQNYLYKRLEMIIQIKKKIRIDIALQSRLHSMYSVKDTIYFSPD